MKLFLTSWPSGELKPVRVIEKHRTISDAVYIRYENGKTDTTTDKFLFAVPESITTLQAEIDELVEMLGHWRRSREPCELSNETDKLINKHRSK